jgi:4'-phosphopantetheinyl transferase
MGCERSDVPADRSWLTSGERAHAASLRFVKRREDFVLRRWTAKRALAAVVGLPSDVASLSRLEGRSTTGSPPEAYLDRSPLPVTLSLSDRAGRAVCVVSTDGEPVGCDVELVEPRSDAFVRDWFTAAEASFVDASVLPGERHLVANLVWSAKESALKVLGTGLRRDTRSVEVRVPAGGAASDRWVALSVVVDDGRTLHGWWRTWDRYVVTVVAGGRIGQPRELVSAGP